MQADDDDGLQGRIHLRPGLNFNNIEKLARFTNRKTLILMVKWASFHVRLLYVHMMVGEIVLRCRDRTEQR